MNYATSKPLAQFTEGDVASILTNPFYCLGEIAPAYAEEHEPDLSEADWVASTVRMIDQIGPVEYLRSLLTDLKA